MRFVNKLLFVTIILFVFTSCGSLDKSEYYLKYSINPSNLQFEGHYRIDKNKVNDTRCFQFSRNEDGQLIEIVELYAGKVTTKTENIKIKYEGNFEERLYLKKISNKDLLNIGRTFGNQPYRSRIEYSERNYPIRQFYYDSLGSLLEDNSYFFPTYYTFKIDTIGRIIEAIPHNKKNEINSEVARKLYVYSETSIVEEILEIGKYALNNKYDKFSNIMRVRIFETDTQTPSEFDGIGDEICYDNDYRSRIDYDVYVVSIKYDNNGRTIERVASGIDGKLVISIEETPDEFGNIKELRFLDSNNLPYISNHRNYVSIIYKYDSTGNKTEESFYGIYEKPVEDNGYHKLLYKYNDRLVCIDTMKYDKNLILIE